jgi:rSAM/selenodomain-associated transferase 1
VNTRGPTALLMLKAPVVGEVKTRLGREIGAEAATRAYRALVEHQLRQVPRGWRVHVHFAPEGALDVMREWLGAAHEYSAQAAGDLGERLTAACEDHFRGAGGPLVFLGGDCPYLDGVRLNEAAAALREVDVAVVPAMDGGYCLLGLRKAEPRVFQEIRWSTEAVMEQTRERLRGCGLKWRELAAAEDVDDGGSWTRAVAGFPELGR